MANETTPVISSIWCPIITEGRDIELPASAGNKRRIANLQVYCYDEMIKRLNGANQGKSGYFLRRLWKKHEDGLTMHANDVYGEQHEQYQKANRSEFEKKHRKGDIEFRKNGSGAWGVYSDWLYDTYQKDWSKAFQLTFYGFFKNIDYLSHNGNDKFFSYTRINPRFRYANPDGSLSFLWFFSEMGICQLGEVIKFDAENLRVSGKLSAMQGLPKHDKAILYCILGGVYHRGRYPGEDMYGLGQDAAFWPSAEHDFLRRLASEAFAHIAAAAIVNANAFQAVKTYLPNVHGMFVEMLETLTLGLEGYEVNGGGGGGSESKCYPLPLLTIDNPFSDEIHRGILRERFPNKSEEEIMRMDKIKIMDQGFPEDIIQIIKNEIKCANDYVEYRKLVIAITQHHLYMTEKANNKEKEYYELTCVLPHFCGKHYNTLEIYQGYYDPSINQATGKEKGHTMGLKFSELVGRHKPGLVIHLHPLIDDLGDWQRNGPHKTMFSQGDQDNFSGNSLWIGIQPFKERNNRYYVDTYISRNCWGTDKDKYGVYQFPAMHMERIEGEISRHHANLKIIKVEKGKDIKCE